MLALLAMLSIADLTSAQQRTFTPTRQATVTPAQNGTFTPLQTFTPFRTFTPIETFTPILTFTPVQATPTPTASPSAGAVSPTPSGDLCGFVTNYALNAVTVVNVAAREVSGTFPAGASPIGVAVTPDGAELYVSNDLGITIIDTATKHVVAVLPTFVCGGVATDDPNYPACAQGGVGASPRFLAVTPDGRFVFAAAVETGAIFVIDVTTHTVANIIGPNSGEPVSAAIALAPNGNPAYVGAFFPGNPSIGRIRVIDTAAQTESVSKDIGLGSAIPTGIVVTPDGSRLYVNDDTPQGSVSVIDTATSTIFGQPLQVGINAGNIVMSPDGARVYVVACETTPACANGLDSVSVIDTAANAVLGFSPLIMAPLGALAITPDGQFLYATSDNSVAVIDLATMTVVDSIPMDSPTRIVFGYPLGGCPPPTPTATPTNSPTATPTATATETPTATATPTVTTTATATRTGTATASASATPSPTATRTSTSTSTATPTRTMTPTITATRTPTPCGGDCDQSGSVTVDELIKGVKIALDALPVAACPPFDTNGDGQVTIQELVAAVGNALNGCGYTPPTPLPTHTPRGTPTATSTATSTASWTPNGTATATDTPTPTASLTATPTRTPTATPRIVQINIGSGRGLPGGTATVTVSLITAGVGVAGTENYISFEADLLDLNPTDCIVNPAIKKTLVASIVEQDLFNKTLRLDIGSNQNRNTIPDGPLYVCTLHISPSAPLGVIPLSNGNMLAFGPDGSAVDNVIGADGSVTVSLVP